MVLRWSTNSNPKERNQEHKIWSHTDVETKYVKQLQNVFQIK